MTRRKKRRGYVPLREEHAVTMATAESRLIAIETLRMLRGSTTPERWKTIRAYALGTSVKDLAARERVPIATIYNRIRLARANFAAVLAREGAREGDR